MFLFCCPVIRRVYLSVAAAAIYMASQASEVKKTQKGIYINYIHRIIYSWLSY